MTQKQTCHLCKKDAIGAVFDLPLCAGCLQRGVEFGGLRSAEEMLYAAGQGHAPRASIRETPCPRCGSNDVRRDPSFGGTSCSSCSETTNRLELYDEVVQLRNINEGLKRRVQHLEFQREELEEEVERRREEKTT